MSSRPKFGKGKNMYYCTYCDYYGHDFTGNKSTVLTHTPEHPIDDFLDMVDHVDNRYEFTRENI